MLNNNYVPSSINLNNAQFLNMYVYIQGGQRTSYTKVFFIENFIMSEIFPPFDKVYVILMFILF